MKTLKSILFSLIFIFVCYSLMVKIQISATLKCNVAALQAGNPAYQVCQFTDQEPEQTPVITPFTLKWVTQSSGMENLRMERSHRH